jgi:hypothetical protein
LVVLLWQQRLLVQLQRPVLLLLPLMPGLLPAAAAVWLLLLGVVC